MSTVSTIGLGGMAATIDGLAAKAGHTVQHTHLSIGVSLLG